MRQIKEGVYAVGAIDWDARLFDKLIPLPDGTSYNSYLVRGNEKVALLDTVDPTRSDVLIDNLVKLGIARIDYVVAHHAEPRTPSRTRWSSHTFRCTAAPLRWCRISSMP